jgi:hypothetical protein
LPMQRVGWRRMANHFHLALWPHNDGDLNRWKQWLLTAPVRHFGKASFAALHSAARTGKRAPPMPWGWNRPCNPAGGLGRTKGQD